jgi:cytochrome P450
MSVVWRHPGRWRPPAPQSRAKPLSPIALLGALWKNPLEVWTHAHFRAADGDREPGYRPGDRGQCTGRGSRVSLDNAANYQKDTLQRRMMSATLGNGLLTAEGEQWRIQRRALASMFARRTVISFAPAMAQAVVSLVGCWHRHGDGAVRDIATDVTLLTLDVLERPIFSEGLGGDPEEVRTAMRSYFDIIGRIEPSDLLGLPDFVPRLGRMKARPALQFFDQAVDTIIATRRRRLAEDPSSMPDDILTLVLKTQDPESGQAMSEAKVRANIITFIAAGHETIANTISWSLFLLSQSPRWQERRGSRARDRRAGPRRTSRRHPGGDRGSHPPSIHRLPPSAG